jgi:hypothetical protein
VEPGCTHSGMGHGPRHGASISSTSLEPVRRAITGGLTIMGRGAGWCRQGCAVRRSSMPPHPHGEGGTLIGVELIGLERGAAMQLIAAAELARRAASACGKAQARSSTKLYMHHAVCASGLLQVTNAHVMCGLRQGRGGSTRNEVYPG